MKGITLIGMPGAGKSTVGKMLAERLDYRFLDLDVLIKEKTGRGHAEILEKDGRDALVNLENRLTLELNLTKTVLSPGGSIIYSPKAMDKLRQETSVIYLELPLEEIQKRLGENLYTRGIIGLKEIGLAKLYQERAPLHYQFAHHIINCSDLTEQEVLKTILMFLRTLE
jgi:shikimate kinase